MKITIRPAVINGDQKRWCVDHTCAGERTRTFWPSKAAAKVEATRLKEEEGQEWARLEPEVRTRLARMELQAQERGTSLAKIFAQWQAGPAYATDRKPVTLAVLISECLEAKRSAGCREVYLTNLRQCLTAFARGREALPASRIQLAEIETWIEAKSGSSWTRGMWRARLGTLFAFGVRRDYLDRNPVLRLEPIRNEQAPVVIFTPAQCRQLMECARQDHPEALAWFALALFAGIRPSECDRLRWEDLDLTTGIVRVEAAASKVRRRRIVPLEPVAIAWLQEAKKLAATLPFGGHPRRTVLESLRACLGLTEWPTDVLRHTAASHLVAHHQDTAKVALWLGNSATVLLRHYREVVTKEQAAEWLAIRP